ncbi:MAG: methyltransferase domain-containing protein [Deltaproteobacteria bacterium]|nr:methyltransferase domain-containing protein [Deltaproteobacteria bacterium]
MKLSLLDIFACPACGHQELAAGPSPLPRNGRLIDGELRCSSCSRAYPVRDGVPDFVMNGRRRPSPSQRLMEMAPITRIYEEQWRPQLVRAVSPGLTFDEELRTVTRWLRLEPGDRLLDLACGPGLYTRPLAKLVAGDGAKGATGDVIGVDISGPMLKEAVKLAAADGIGNVIYIRADVQNLPFRKRAQFSHATCMAAFHLFPDPTAVTQAVGGLLKKGGAFCLLTTRTSRTPWIRAAERLSSRFSGLRFFDESELDGMFRASGLVPGERKQYGPVVLMIEARAQHARKPAA